MQACALPVGSKGREALARGKLMGAAQAALQFQVPHDDRAVLDCLQACQRSADSLVLGARRPLRAAAAKQPKECMGLGHLNVRAHMCAVWAKPLLATAGSDLEHRPFKHFYAQYARRAYPALDMGRELLTLNLSFHAVAALPRAAKRARGRQRPQGRRIGVAVERQWRRRRRWRRRSR